MREALVGCYVDTEDGWLAAFASDGPDVYVFPEMKWPDRRSGPFSETALNDEDLAGANLIYLRAPVRYRRVGYDEFEVGYYDPGHFNFFRWRGVMARGVDVRFDPRRDVISPELAPRRRIERVIDVDPPSPAAASEAAGAAVFSVPLQIPSDKNISLTGMEYIAATMRPAWIVSNANYTPAYVDRQDDRLIYRFPELIWPGNYGPPPGTDEPRSVPVIAEDQLHRSRVVQLHAPTTYRRLEEDKLEPGYYDPAHRIFFRWRDVVHRENYEVSFAPEFKGIPTELPPSRVDKTVDVDPPPERTPE